MLADLFKATAVVYRDLDPFAPWTELLPLAQGVSVRRGTMLQPQRVCCLWKAAQLSAGPGACRSRDAAGAGICALPWI